MLQIASAILLEREDTGQTKCSGGACLQRILRYKGQFRVVCPQSGHYPIFGFCPVCRSFIQNLRRTPLTGCQRFTLGAGDWWIQLFSQCSLAYSALACFKMGTSGSASFQSVRKS